MKKLYILLSAVLLLAGSSCSDWLDVRPSDTLTQDELFAEGDGYRVTLNGVYRQMSETSLYGSALTWGYLDAAAQMYSSWYLGTNTLYDKFASFEYTDSKVEDVIDGIWSKMYNSIANCNNLLAQIEEAPASKFRGGEEERQLIKGEALALRAFLHLDILRLFAPAPVKDDGKDYIPYVDTYPCTFKEYSSNREVLDRIIADLQAAKELVKPFDTAEERAYWMTTNARIENFEGSGVGNPPSDIFFTYRGYRMNYYAICAALARAYNYAGPYDAENYKRAFDETQPVIDGAYEGNSYFTFTYPSTGNTRLYHDVIFCLSNQKTVTNYSDATADNTKFYINDASYLFDDQSDVRYAVLLNTTSYNVLSLKYSDESNSYCADLLPVLRLSEMYYIRAEYYYTIGDNVKAADEIDVVREGRNCSKGKYSQVIASDPEGWFGPEIVKEANREFVGEGQLFYYYKRLGIDPDYVYDANFVFPLPDSESAI